MEIKQILLRKTILADLEHFFEFQLDEEANYLAAFTSKDSKDKNSYIIKYSKFVNDSTKNLKTIIVDDKIVGSISTFVMHGDHEITYWIDKNHWGKGITSSALRTFLKGEKVRPIFGRVAFDNYGSQRVLEKGGFVKVGSDFGFANARNAEIEEFVYKLS